ncbi:hypothetical protein ACOME3_010262 [Neoechinorhynchus agilis]
MVCDSGDIKVHMNAVIEETREIVGLAPTIMRLLLHHFRWDKARLLERFFDTDMRSICAEAHIFQLINQYQTSNEMKGTDIRTCVICFTAEDELKDKAKLLFADCHHYFCKECGLAYISQKILRDGISTVIPCPGDDCNMFIDDGLVSYIAGCGSGESNNLLRMYDRAITNSFVECNREFRWCPGVGCDLAIRRLERLSNEAAICRCKKAFCFDCGYDWHEPVTCYWLKKWLKRCKDDSETSNWLAAHTKECPKCQACIEKAGGCNHIICMNAACHHEFCWVCLGPWKPHGSTWYSCNRFNEEDAKRAQTEQEKSRAALLRYLHYYNRYVNHLHSLKFENKLQQVMKRKMEELQTAGNSWIEVQFLCKGVVLLNCRQTLMYTYVFAFYLKRNNQSDVFERNQADLERATEELSSYLERDKPSNIVELKKTVQDSYRYCESRRTVLLNHVRDGYDNDYWEYQECL